MSVRIVQPASGGSYMTFAWGDGTEILTAGKLIDVPPGSGLETAIGVTNLAALTGQARTSTRNGGRAG